MHDHLRQKSRQTIIEQINKMPCVLDQRYQQKRHPTEFYGRELIALLDHVRS